MPRYYHSGSGGPDFRFAVQMTETVKWLIIINVAIFFLQGLVFMASRGQYFSLYFGVSANMFLRGMIWQPVTYMFLHASIGHIFWNMLILWMFGCEIEREWGSRAFLRYYFITGIGGGVMILLTSMAMGDNHITLGASGAIFGLLVAFGMLFPDRIILAFFLFPMRARNFVLLLGVIELWVTIMAGPYGGRVARFAHLGGALVGFLYLKFGDRIKYSIPRIRFKTNSRNEPKAQDWSSFMREEVDPILDKIGREGIHSLTRKERNILKKARGHKRNSG
jgi:membrane associated rhomboid family serine protease